MNKVLCLLAIVSFAGCSYPIFDQPIVAPDESKACPELLGAFRTSTPDSKRAGFLHIGEAGKSFPKGLMKVIFVDHKVAQGAELSTGQFVVWAHKVKDSYLIQIPLPEGGEESDQFNAFGVPFDSEKIDQYWIMRLRLEEERLYLGFLSEEFLGQQIESGKLPGVVDFQPEGSRPDEPGKIRVSASTEQLVAYFNQVDMEKLFKDEEVEYLRIN